VKNPVSEFLNIGMDLLTPKALVGRRQRNPLMKTHGTEKFT
jgi:hypothetical protein